MSRLRIIAGHYGGRAIRALAGDTTRPTTDRVREAWASTVISLLPQGFARARVLDAFAGSGALGLEALSRGAGHVTFCERDRRALDVLKANRDALDSEHETTAVLTADTFAPQTLRFLSAQGPFDLVILDPPYACTVNRVATFLCALAKVGSLSNGALVTYERLRPDVPIDDGFPAGFQMVSCKIYGLTQVEYFLYQ